MEKPIKNSDMLKAVKKILRINYNYYLLDIFIAPGKLMCYLAVQFRNDPSKIWYPRVIVYLSFQHLVGIFTHLRDAEPTWLSSSTIMTMAEIKVPDPNPRFPNPIA